MKPVETVPITLTYQRICASSWCVCGYGYTAYGQAAIDAAEAEFEAHFDACEYAKRLADICERPGYHA